MESSLNMLKNLVTSMESKTVEMKQSLEEPARPDKPVRSSSLPVDDLIDLDQLSSSSEDDTMPGTWLLPASATPVPNALKNIRESFRTNNLSPEDKIIRENAITRLCLPAWSLTNSYPEKEQQAYEERVRRASQSPKSAERAVRRLSGQVVSDAMSSPPVPSAQNSHQPVVNSPLVVPKNSSSVSAVSARSARFSQSDSIYSSAKEGGENGPSPVHSNASFELNPAQPAIAGEPANMKPSPLSSSLSTPDRSRMARPVKRLSPLPSQAAAAKAKAAAEAAAGQSTAPTTHTTITTTTLRPSSRPSSRPQSRGVSPIRRGVSPGRTASNISASSLASADSNAHLSGAPTSSSMPRTIPTVVGAVPRANSTLPRRGTASSGIPRAAGSRLPAPGTRTKSNFGFKPKPR